MTWEHALTECEARLDAASAALERRIPGAIPEFSVPDVAGPIPDELADRARACATRSEELEGRLTDELDRIRAELRRLPRMPRAESENRFEVQA
jgi:hypothetical protein